MKRARKVIGILGLLMTLPFLIWLPLGWLGVVPSMIEFYGMEGLRIPSSFVIGGLLIAAVGFYEF